jgi:AAHS family 4-hydroxybenzoate transporter-like MFS transporter
MRPAAPDAINVSRLLDERPLGGFQISVIVLCALVALLDGFDTQAIGFTAPALSKELGLAPSLLGTVFSAGLLGATVGAMVFGAVSDRFGRKRPMLVAVLVFAVFSLATIGVSSGTELVACRFLAGLGLGGALPSFIALTSEYVAQKRRSVAVGALWAGFPIGGMLGGFSSSWLIPHEGWRAVFIVGGVLPLLVAAALVIWLPESLRFLIARAELGTGGADPRIGRIMRRLAPEVPVARTYTVDEERIAAAPVAALFTDGRALTTILLWVPFFCVFMMLAVVVLWTPSLLHEMGLTAATGALLIAGNNFGSAIGNVGCGALLDRVNPYPVLAAAFGLGGLMLVPIGVFHDQPIVMAGCLLIAGLFLGAGSGGALVLAARSYPTLMRSTGVGWGMAMGRFGQVIGPVVAGAMVAGGLNILHIFVALFGVSLVASLAVLMLGGAVAARGRAAATSLA